MRACKNRNNHKFTEYFPVLLTTQYKKVKHSQVYSHFSPVIIFGPWYLSRFFGGRLICL